VYTSTNGIAPVFEILRGEIGIERLIETNGHRKALCVSHSEHEPSMHVYEDHVHCYGCGFHGDVVDVWAVQRGIGRPIEAALDLAWEFNVRLPEMSEESRRKAEEQREREFDLWLEARKYHRNVKKKGKRVREWWESRGFSPEIQERFLLGADRGAATIPFWVRGGRVAGIIRRKLEGEPKYLNPEGERPLFIPGPTKGEIFLVEGYIDALAVGATGRSVVAVGGDSDLRRAEPCASEPPGTEVLHPPRRRRSGG
jgi:DNA primase